MNEDDEPTLRFEEIAMAKMIKAKARELGFPMDDASLMEVIKAHREVMQRLGYKRKKG